MKKIFVVCIVAVIGVLTSYSISVISGVLLFLERDALLSTLDKQWIVSIILLGAMGGASLAGPVADHFGRKPALLSVGLFYVVGGLLSLQLPWLLVARFLTGVGVGASSVVAPLYLAEVSPAKIRGAVVTGFQLAVTLGILVSYWINFWYESVVVSFGLGSGLAVFITVGLLFIPESPSWQIERGRLDRRFLFPLLIGGGLSIFQQLTGINTIIYYGPMIFRMAGFGNELLATLGIGLVNVVATVIALFWIDRLGRRRLLLVGLTGIIASLVSLSLFFHLPGVALLSVMGYVVFFAISLGAIVWVVVSEIFPKEVRGRAVAIATFINWLSNYVVSFFFLRLLEIFGGRGVFLLFALVSCVALLFVYFLVPETKGKSLEEIQNSWYS